MPETANLFALILKTRRKAKPQLPRIRRKRIRQVIDDARRIKVGRERDLVLLHQPRSHETELVARKVLADAVEPADRERRECVLVLNQLGLGIPSFGNEVVGFAEAILACARG